MAARFKTGDLIDIYMWDHGGDKFLEGIVLIEEYVPHYPTTINGAYKLRTIKGNSRLVAINSDTFDKVNTNIWIGNIEDNPTLKALYGTRSN